MKISSYIYKIIAGILLVQLCYLNNSQAQDIRMRLDVVVPEVMEATEVDGTSFRANWQDSPGSARFLLDVSQDLSFNSFLNGYNSKELTSNTEKVTGLTEETTYYYRVRAVNNGGKASDYSSVMTVSSVLSAPGNFAAEVDEDQVTLSWTDASGRETGFRLDRSVDSDANYALLATLPQDANTYKDENLEEGTRYFYRLAAFNSNTSSIYQYTSAITEADDDDDDNDTENKPPTIDAIADISVDTKNPATERITLTGISPGEGENQNVTIVASSDRTSIIPNPEVIYTSPASTAILQFKPKKNTTGIANISVILNDGAPTNNITTQTFEVTATSENSEPTSSDKTITINDDETYTFAVTDFAFSDDDGDTFQQIRINSLPVSGTLQLANTPVSPNQEIGVGNITTLTYTPAAGASGDNYASFTFSVSDGTAYSINAYTITFNVTAAVEIPVAPVATAATGVGQNSFTANWNAVTGATSYRLDVLQNGTALAGFNNLTVSGTSQLVR